MSTALTKTTKVCGIGGVVMIAAAQTSPQEAISNLAGWLRLLGIKDIPAFLNTVEADFWVTMLGVLSLSIAAIAGLRRKKRRRYTLDDRSLGGLERALLGTSPAPQSIWDRVWETSLRRLWRAGGLAQELRRQAWIPLGEALRYLTVESAWSQSISIYAGDDPEDILKREFFDAAARNEVSVRGYRRTSEIPFRLAAASEPIPPEFWRYAGMQPFAEIYFAAAPGRKDPARPAVFQERSKFPDAVSGLYGRVTVNTKDLLALWPPTTQPSSSSALSKALERYIKDNTDPKSDFEFRAAFGLQAA